VSSYLVTGGAGFIGSHLAEELLRRGQRVRVADSLITGKRSNLDHIPGVEFFEGDLADLAFAVRSVAGMDYVLHQAAIPSVPRSVIDPIASHHANTDATLNVLVAARDAGVKRLVFAGSSSEYGNTPTLPKREDMTPSPLSPYALQKVIGTQYCQMFTRLYGFETVVIRYFNVFGPRQDPSSPYSGVISVFATALSEGRRPTIFGDGEQTRDYVYVGDVVRANVAAVAATATGPINIGTGIETSVNRLYGILAAVADSDRPPAYAPARPGEQQRSVIAAARAGRELRWQPEVALDEGLRRTYRFFQERLAQSP
jgi:nucleoside-diphosphate-sugar epimerase